MDTEDVVKRAEARRAKLLLNREDRMRKILHGSRSDFPNSQTTGNNINENKCPIEDQISSGNDDSYAINGNKLVKSQESRLADSERIPSDDDDDDVKTDDYAKPDDSEKSDTCDHGPKSIIQRSSVSRERETTVHQRKNQSESRHYPQRDVEHVKPNGKESGGEEEGDSGESSEEERIKNETKLRYRKTDGAHFPRKVSLISSPADFKTAQQNQANKEKMLPVYLYSLLISLHNRAYSMFPLLLLVSFAVIGSFTRHNFLLLFVVSQLIRVVFVALNKPHGVSYKLIDVIQAIIAHLVIFSTFYIAINVLLQQTSNITILPSTN